ncbi:hypothetical protein LINPERHAP1_LOCUS37457, partial [Linum perenne]
KGIKLQTFWRGLAVGCLRVYIESLFLIVILFIIFGMIV